MDIFHKHRQASEHGLAAAVLERALQTAEYRPEALIWKGIAALPQTPELAFLFFTNAAQALPDRADIHALVGRSLLAQSQAVLATRYLTTAWQQQPNDPALRMVLWQARRQSETPAELRRMILDHLPEISAGNELSMVLKLLAGLNDAPTTVGVVRYLPEQREIQGWAIDLRNLQTPIALKLEANGGKLDTVASAPHPLLTAAGLPASHGGIRISVPNPTAAVHVSFTSGAPLLGSPVFAMPAFTPPTSVGSDGQQQPVDVLIPVYNGLDETLECITSALVSRKLNSTPHRLVVVDDATPLPGLAKALKVLAAKGKITLVRNSVNLGFIHSMNRAMGLSPSKDVVWLNADTRVHGAWLDRLRKVAYSEANIASVTPFTNNGELMSFPQSQVSHAMPNAREQAELDELARNTDSPPMEIETGCGFCLYIKRAALDQVGYLDDVHLSRGYGEETDWCLRARSLGWKHMGAPNVFVAHQGGISFGPEKILRVAQNNAILRHRYPDASARYKAFCTRDPIKPARQALQKARLRRIVEQAGVSKALQRPAQLFTTLRIHNGSGSDAPFSITWRRDGHRTWVTLKASLRPLPINLDFVLPEEFGSLVESLRALPLKEIIFEHLDYCPPQLCELPTMLDTSYRVMCRDDRLLSRDNTHDWKRFAREATNEQLPWQALQSMFAAALPDAKLVVVPGAEYTAPPDFPPRAVLIGDELNSADIVRHWLNVGRLITREQLPLLLLAKDDTPGIRALLATGAVQVLPELHGFSLAERARSAGCDAVLSLSTAPNTDWSAPALARELAVPLYAWLQPLSVEAGAATATFLPFSLSQA